MNEFVENHGVFTPEEFVRLVNLKLFERDPSARPITIGEAKHYHNELGYGVDTVVEEQLHVWHVYG